MRKLHVLVAFMAIALVVPLAVSGQKGKPPKPPVYTPCTFEQNINSGEDVVQAGRDVGTYGPADERLYIHESLLPTETAPDPTGGIALVKGAPLIGGYYGPYYGQIRVLDNRIDYWFDTAPHCGEAMASTSPCRFRAVVVDGVPLYEKSGKTRVLTRVEFSGGRYLLDYRWCDPATNPACYVKLYGCYDDRDCPTGEGFVYATVNVLFQ